VTSLIKRGEREREPLLKKEGFLFCLIFILVHFKTKEKRREERERERKKREGKKRKKLSF